MEKQFEIKLNEEQIRVLGDYMDVVSPAPRDIQRELQNVIDRAIEAYAEAICDEMKTNKSN